MKIIAVILAGGSGKRMGLDRPKQFLLMNGKTILEHSVDAFHENPFVNGIIIVSNPDFIDEAESIVEERRAAGEWTKVETVIAGGKERSDSSVNALKHVADALPYPAQLMEADVAVLFHDAVRPLVSQQIINDVCLALRDHEAVNVTVPVVDTIVRTTRVTSSDGHECTIIADTVDRSVLQSVQTPQGFRLATIAEAYRRAMADSAFKATDDCGVVMRYLPEVKIGIVNGSAHNLKLTYAADLPLFEYLLSSSGQ